MKSRSRRSPIALAKIIANLSFDQCVPMTETTHWSNDGLIIIFSYTIGDPLTVNFAFLTIVTIEQLTLTQT